MKNTIKNKKIIIQADFSTGQIPSYFTGATPVITALPENKYSHTSLTTSGTTSVTSTFTLQSNKYDKITFELKDVKLSNDQNVTSRFGFIPKTGEPNTLNALFNYSNGTLSVISFIDGVNQGGSFHKNFNLKEPHDFKIIINIKEKYVDYIVEGSRLRVNGVNNLNELAVEFSRISTSDGVAKTVSFKEFKLTLE